MPVDAVAVAPHRRRGHERLTVDDVADMADEGAVEDGIDGRPVVPAALGQPTNPRSVARWRSVASLLPRVVGHPGKSSGPRGRAVVGQARVDWRDQRVRSWARRPRLHLHAGRRTRAGPWEPVRLVLVRTAGGMTSCSRSRHASRGRAACPIHDEQGTCAPRWRDLAGRAWCSPWSSCCSPQRPCPRMGWPHACRDPKSRA